MTVIVQSKTMPVTAALRDFVQRQAIKLTKLSNRISDIHVYIEKIAHKRNDPHASAVKFEVFLPGTRVVVQRRATDMYVAVVDTTRSVMEQLRKWKERRLSGRRG